nr:SH3-like domain-containing protein [Virgibacillus halodenitrificans]
MKKSDLSLHRHLLIDEEEKTFELSGSGSAFTKPWGGKSDIVYGDLRSLQGQQVSVIRTEKVGKNVWRKCIVKNEEVWIHNKHLIRSRQP